MRLITVIILVVNGNAANRKENVYNSVVADMPLWKLTIPPTKVPISAFGFGQTSFTQSS